MSFKDYEYKRPNYEEIKVKFDKLVEEFKNVETFELCNEKFIEIRKMRNTKQTMKSICDMRNNINTEDKFYSEEIKYWNESDPLFEELDNKFFEALINSNFRNKLEEEYSQQLFKMAELKLKGFSKDVIEEVQIENSLISQYKKLIGSAKIKFQGKEMNLSELLKYKESKNRDVRKAASSAYSKFFEDNEEEFDNIYDGLVKVRDKMAKKLGYKNYVELGYIKRYRIDFNAEMVKVFRKQVKEYVVPLVSKLIEKQRERLNLETLEYYDEEVEFNSGNATPNGDTSWIIEKAMEMYAELSDNIKGFFEIMVKDELMDLDSKKGKSGGAYCNFIHDYNMPIIFLNFNGTCRDVDSLNHEVGHAFQSYCSRDVANMDEIIFPTYEAAEIHSTALEFITWP